MRAFGFRLLQLWWRLDFLPGRPRSRSSHVRRVRQKVEHDYLFDRFSLPYRKLLVFVLKLTWWPRAIGHSFRAFTKDGLAVERQYRLTRWAQLKQILKLALQQGVPPSAYYRLDLFREENRSRATEFIFRHEIVFFLRQPPRPEVVHDKYLFARLCAHHGWPHPPLLAHSLDGRVFWDGELGQGRVSVLAKPRRGSRGVGIVSLEGTPEEVRRHFLSLGAECELILQAKIEPPAGWAEAPVFRFISTPDRVVLGYPSVGVAPEEATLAKAREMVALAHKELTDFPALGWDVLMGAGGPVLLEANLGWDVETPQRIFGPLADFEDLLREGSNPKL